MASKSLNNGGPLQAALLDSSNAASKRAADAQAVFNPIAKFLDSHRATTSGLEQHLKRALTALSEDLAAVAKRHFDAYITGTVPLHIPSPTCKPHSPPPSRPLSGLSQSTYASCAALPAKPPAVDKQSKNPNSTHTQTKQTLPAKAPSPDLRLFVRLPANHIARNMQSYAIYSSLRAQLRGTVLREVQTTKTGFALCPTTPDALPALAAQKDTISAFFGGCQVERSIQWVSYRIMNVPRTIGKLDKDKYSLIRLDPETMTREITKATGLLPSSVSETSDSAKNIYSPSSSWFVNFAEGTKPTLPRQLRLFGAATNPCLLTQRTKVIQCNRCWKWHNPRSCARPFCCRLCGSTQHTEEGHKNQCNTPSPHHCPPRCLHCHGPFPADHPDCLLRPNKKNIAFTKTQQAEIRKTCALTLLEAHTRLGCNTAMNSTITTPITAANTATADPNMTADSTMAIDSEPTGTDAPKPANTPIQVFSPFRPTTPPTTGPPTLPPATAHSIRFASPQNRFNSLLEEQL
jgi:hypothetical protein